MDRFLTKNIKNGTERGWNDWKKNERERNKLDGGPFQNGVERFHKR